MEEYANELEDRLTVKNQRVGKLDDIAVNMQPADKPLSSEPTGFSDCKMAVMTMRIVVNINLSRVSHRFLDTATYSLKVSTKNCGQTAADEDIVTIDNL